MTGYRIRSTRGRIASGEDTWLWDPIGKKQEIGAIYLRGAGAPSQYADASKVGSVGIAPSAALRGIPGIAGTMGAGDPFGNDTVGMPRVTAHGDYLAEQTGVSDEKYHIVGTSMGGYTGLRWTVLNPTKVASLTLFLPLVDIVGAYDANIAGLAPLIATAWGVTHPNPLPSSVSVISEQALEILSNIPILIGYDDSDPITLQQPILDLAAATGADLMETPLDNAHSEWSIGEFMDFDDEDPFDIDVDWDRVTQHMLDAVA